VCLAEDLLGRETVVRAATDAKVRHGVRASERSRLHVIDLEMPALRTALARFVGKRARRSPSRSKTARRTPAEIARARFIAEPESAPALRAARGVFTFPSRSFSSFAIRRSIAASITTARSPLGLRWRIKSHARSSFAFRSAPAVSCT
jgi:hypothetical protein